MSTVIVCVPGTWESPDASGMLGRVTRKLSKNTDVRWIDYSGDYGRVDSYETSYHRGFEKACRIIETISQEGHDVIILGFSQGADIAGYLAERIARGVGPIHKDRVKFVGLLADPRRRSTDTPVPTPGKRGIVGAREDGSWGSLLVFSYAVDGDLIPSCPENLTLLSSVTEASIEVLLSTPEQTNEALTSWVNTKYNRAPWWIKFSYWLQLPNTLAALALNVGKHELYHVTGGPRGAAATDDLAGHVKATINQY